MESSPKFSGDAEECSSSESGWTMYLASPMHSDQHNNSDVCDDGAVAAEDGGTIGGQKEEEEEEEDDSMASDASSGTPYKKWNGDIDGVKERSSVVERGKGRERSSKRRDSADSIHGSYKIRKARSSHK